MGKIMRCETCQAEATIHIEAIDWHFCESCLQKIDKRIAELKSMITRSEESLRMLENDLEVMKALDFWKNLRTELKESPEPKTDSALLEAARKVVRIRYGAQSDDGWDQLKNSIAELADVVEKLKD